MDTRSTRKILEILDDLAEMSPADRPRHVEKISADDAELKSELLSHLSYLGEDTLTEVPSTPRPMPKIPVYAEFERRYELGEEIDRGGVGIIRKAIDKNLERVVAIKILRDEFKDAPDMVSRFVTEAKISARLTHPGIVPVHEIGRSPLGNPYIVMKLVEGNTFSFILNNSKSSESEFDRYLEIFERICQTVAYSHSHSVIHRDLKPGNVMVSSFGEVHVMDWGLAKLVSGFDDERGLFRSEDDGGSSAAPEQTQIGTILGTPAYLAPEQTVGLAVPQIDVFSLGGILCRILTGKPPYQGADATEVLEKATEGRIQEAHDRLRECGAPTELVQLASDCIEIEMHKRPADAAAVLWRISRYRQSVLERAKAAELANEEARVLALEQKKRSRIKLRTASLAFIFVIIAIAAFFVQQAEHSEEVIAVQSAERQSAEKVSYWATLLAAFREYDSGDSHQANQILESSPEDFRSWEWNYLRNTIGTSSKSYFVPEQKIKFSIALGDASHVAVIDDAGVTQIVDMDNDRVVDEIDSPMGRPMAVSDNGQFVLSLVRDAPTLQRDTPVKSSWPVLWETRTGKIVQTFESIPMVPELSQKREFAISPDGRYVSSITSAGHWELGVYESETGNRLQTFEVGRRGRGGTFSPDSTQFVYSGPKQIYFWDLENQREARPPIDEPALVLRFNPDGTLLAASQQDQTLIWNLKNGTHVNVPLKLFPNQETFVEFSPDGSELAAAISYESIHVWSSDTGTLLGRHGINKLVDAKLGHYSWVNGKLLVPSVDDEGSFINQWDLDIESARTLSGHSGYVYPVAITSDGSVIVSGGWDKTLRIWDAETKRELHKSEGHTSFLHDLDIDELNGTVGSIDMESEVCLWDLTTGKRLANQTFENPLNSSFYRKRIVYNRPRHSYFGHSGSALFEVNATNLNVIKTIDLSLLPGRDRIDALKVSPDGRTLLLCSASQTGLSEIVFLNAETFEKTRSMTVETSASQFAFSPDGARFAIGFFDGNVGVWNNNGVSQPLWVERHHVNEVFGMVFSADGSRLFTGGRDATIRVWDPADGTAFGPLRGHGDYVYSLDISGDGSRLVSGSGDATVRIWESPQSTPNH